MKKYILSLIALLATIFLVACQQTDIDAENQYQATVTIQLADEEIEKTVTVEEGDSVMDVLEENFTVEENDGFVTSIDGIGQDTTKGVYWMYDVNGEMAQKGAEEQLVEEGDEIRFYQITVE